MEPLLSIEQKNEIKKLLYEEMFKEGFLKRQKNEKEKYKFTDSPDFNFTEFSLTLIGNIENLSVFFRFNYRCDYYEENEKLRYHLKNENGELDLLLSGQYPEIFADIYYTKEDGIKNVRLIDGKKWYALAKAREEEHFKKRYIQAREDKLNKEDTFFECFNVKELKDCDCIIGERLESGSWLHYKGEKIQSKKERTFSREEMNNAVVNALNTGITIGYDWGHAVAISASQSSWVRKISNPIISEKVNEYLSNI